ncbi:NAD(P)-binding protein [Rhizobium sp. B230/85]|uniref:NAD(P)-binding protein n=1 Tax=unclassified Rhizobium TaxID=2613769 RepID=UPI001ADA6B24|nr:MULTISPECIES: NAD(P)-binding protein [unclassified Rhizobium]MBO9135273.1 NAD(P)-binding protein [Rhizobium sp. B209b/85]QXZ98916.1 NAD(P)-binding protein [Rhizobium sp. B230/85]
MTDNLIHQDRASYFLEEEFDAVVLGAGISGLVSAAILSRQGHRNILIIDDYEHVGGNHLDWSSNGYTFDIGSLVFQDDSPLLFYFPELLPLYLPIEPEWARLNPQGMVTSYPISIRDDIFGSGPVGTVRIFASVIFSRLFRRRMDNAHDFARFWIGEYLLGRSGLESYMQRFYGISTTEIDIDLAKKRMMWISEHASLRKLLSRLLPRRPSGKPNRQLARPKAGFSALYKVAVDKLETEGVAVSLSAQMRSIEKAGSQFRLRTKDRIVVTSRLISTTPIERTVALCGLDPGPPLETITLIGLFFSFKGDRGFRQPIIYNFSYKGAWKRLTMHSDFYGLVDAREYFGAEVIAHHAGGTIESAEADFREHVSENGLFKGELRLEGARVLSHAYPIYRRGAAQHAAEAIEKLRVFGIESFGRQGGFNYQPTARSSTVEAEEALRPSAA